MSALDISEICFIDAALPLICEVHICWLPLAALSMHHFLQKDPYEVCGHLVYLSLVFHVTHTFHILWNSAYHAFPVPLSFNKIRHQPFVFLCSFNFCSRYPTAGLERRRKHLLTQGRWRNELYENLRLGLCVNTYRAAYLDSIFWHQFLTVTFFSLLVFDFEI